MPDAKMPKHIKHQTEPRNTFKETPLRWFRNIQTQRKNQSRD